MTKSFYQQLHDTIRDAGPAAAYTYAGATRSYAELYRDMRRINAALGGRRQVPVVTYTDKAFTAYSAIFSVILSGNTWVPISLEMPEARAVEVLRQVEPQLILTNLPLPGVLRDYAAGHGIAVLDLAAATAAGEERPFTDLAFAADDIAYIMFTSGSTGVPKGVPMTHANYINFIRNAMTILPFNRHEVFADAHDFAFDISIFYLFCCPLTASAFAPLLLPTERMVPLHFIQENRVTVWSSVPSMISRVQAFAPDACPHTDLRIMFLCGEPFSLKVLDYCFNNLRLKHVYNFYGLTETGVENFYHPCVPADLAAYEPYGFVPIGRPLPGNDIRVTDGKELLVSGCQVTPGYLGGGGAERFEVIAAKRWYHTGDLVEEHLGVWFCKGRMDSQTKLGGYRIELMDIEVHLKRFPGVDEAVAFIIEQDDRKLLAAALRPRPGGRPDLSELKRQLGAVLPYYMIPKRLFLRDDLPVNANGKLDRRRIREMCTAAGDAERD